MKNYTIIGSIKISNIVLVKRRKNYKIEKLPQLFNSLVIHFDFIIHFVLKIKRRDKFLFKILCTVFTRRVSIVCTRTKHVLINWSFLIVTNY